MEHRDYFKVQIKKDGDTGIKQSDGKLVSDEVKIIKTLLECQGRFEPTFLDEPLEDGIRWIMGYSNYINQTFLKEGPRVPLYKKYPKGSIILVDFYGHFGNELTYDHPAIVLAESVNDLIIAPITSSPSIYEDELPYHISLPAGDINLGNRPNNCTIKLEQIRFVSKRRILVNFQSRVSDNEKLKEIDIALMKLVAEYTFNTYEQTNIAYDELKILSENLQIKLTDVLEIAEELEKEYTGLIEENENLINEKEELCSKIQFLEDEFEQLQKENQRLNDELKKLEHKKQESIETLEKSTP